MGWLINLGVIGVVGSIIHKVGQLADRLTKFSLEIKNFFALNLEFFPPNASPVWL